jgi:hypothetical protein
LPTAASSIDAVVKQELAMNRSILALAACLPGLALADDLALTGKAGTLGFGA